MPATFAALEILLPRQYNVARDRQVARARGVRGVNAFADPSKPLFFPQKYPGEFVRGNARSLCAATPESLCATTQASAKPFAMQKAPVMEWSKPKVMGDLPPRMSGHSFTIIKNQG